MSSSRLPLMTSRRKNSFPYIKIMRMLNNDDCSGFHHIDPSAASTTELFPSAVPRMSLESALDDSNGNDDGDFVFELRAALQRRLQGERQVHRVQSSPKSRGRSRSRPARQARGRLRLSKRYKVSVPAARCQECRQRGTNNVADLLEVTTEVILHCRARTGSSRRGTS